MVPIRRLGLNRAKFAAIDEPERALSCFRELHFQVTRRTGSGAVCAGDGNGLSTTSLDEPPESVDGSGR
jgi:hypothetical protein